MSKMLKVVGASWLRTKISSYILGILGVLAILALFVGQMERSQEDGNYSATVFYSKKTGYSIEYWGQSNDLTDIPRGVARAYFRRDIDTTGWSLLEIETDSSYPDEIQAYAAGVVEGALTWSLIHSHLENTVRAKCMTHVNGQLLDKQCDKLRDTLDKSVDLWKSRAADRNDEPFWHHVSLHYTQIDGIFTGWKYGIQRSVSDYDTDKSDLYWLNSVSEVLELQHKLNITLEDPQLETLPGFASALLRIVNETSADGSQKRKIFIAQNAAGRYSSMTRILKRYKLNYHLTPLNSNLVQGTTVEFSGYPGSVTSQDEFYVIRGDNHRMAVTGTTLKNYNPKLWKEVNITEQVPIGPRVTAANHLATSVSSWGHILASNNSGTASKQWLIVDFNRFDNLTTAYIPKVDKVEKVVEVTENGRTKHTVMHRTSTGGTKGLVWLLEQVPGWTHSADLSDALLENGYLATFGLPFFKDIANVTHVHSMRELHGDIFSETNSPRAMLFNQKFRNATTLDRIIKLMRRNNMTRAHTENSTCSGDSGVCASAFWSVPGVRGDLADTHSEPFGVIDTKVVYATAGDISLNITAISSPPFFEINSSKIPMNKGNVATVYTDQFDNEPTINGLKIRDLVKQQQEEAEQEIEEYINNNSIQPFQWSESEFPNRTHEGLPDKWDFGPYRPVWSW